MVDSKVSSLCSNKNLAGFIGYLSAMLLYIVEGVFIQGVCMRNVDSKKLLKIEKYIKMVYQMPTAVLKSELGKGMLLRICAKLIELNFYKSFYQSAINNLALNIINLNDFKDLQKGEAVLISALLNNNFFKILTNVKALSGMVGFSYQARIDNYKKTKTDFSMARCMASFDTYYNFSLYYKNFLAQQNALSSILNSYQNILLKFLNVFKSCFYDKGFFLKKYLNVGKLIVAVNLLPENNANCNFITFIRDAGLLNKII